MTWRHSLQTRDTRYWSVNGILSSGTESATAGTELDAGLAEFREMPEVISSPFPNHQATQDCQTPVHARLHLVRFAYS